ncbi:MAG TPA: TetR family transcriptional regulator [Anaeromyxobacteraceae bacterium]|nr:TetR family transcriptional regulator [Anaeromyxobacteraceae bacterium]
MPRTRRQRRPRDAEATRRTLLDAATSVFAEHGFAGARVDEIAERAGVNKRMIYAYYGDKEGLYREVLSSRLSAPEASQIVADTGEPRRALERLVRWYFRLLSEDGAFARLLAWDMLTGGARRREMLLDSAGPALELVTALGRRAVATGELGPGFDPAKFRAAVVALGLGYSLQHPAMEAARARTGARFTDEEFVDYACRLLLGPGGERG